MHINNFGSIGHYILALDNRTLDTYTTCGGSVSVRMRGVGIMRVDMNQCREARKHWHINSHVGLTIFFFF